MPNGTPGTTRSNIAILHGALKRMKFNIAEDELRSGKLGATSTRAISELQRIHGLPVDGKLNDETVNVLKKENFHLSNITNKTRTKKLQDLLEKAGMRIAKDEKTNRKAGDTTMSSIAEFQRKNGLQDTGKLTEETMNKLHEEVIHATFSTKTQAGYLHKTLSQVVRIGKLGLQISSDEIKKKEIGPTTAAAIKAFQEKYKLNASGKLDKDTLDKMQSVAASQGVKQKLLKAPPVHELSKLKWNLRLNMTSPNVATAQKLLANLGFKIGEAEFKSGNFGNTTRSAVIAYQKAKGLSPTGHIEKDTLKLLNKEVAKLNPGTAASTRPYKVRGSVRNELWNRESNMVIKVFEKTLEGESQTPLITKKNMTNGFFDIIYQPPIDPVTKQPKEKFHLVVKLFKAVDSNPVNDKLISTQTHYNAKQTHWVNFTQTETNYQGNSDFEKIRATLLKATGKIDIASLEESPKKKQVTQLNLETGLGTEDIMRQIIAHKIAAGINKPALTPEVFYAFLRQSLPASLPGDLLRATSDWETIDQLVEQAASGIVFTNDDLTKQVIDTALAQNLVSQQVNVNKEAILTEFAKLRINFTLEKPILVGKSNLKSLLANSVVDPNHYETIAETFINSRGINPDFWKSIDTKSGVVGKDAIADFASTVQIGNISKNHAPTVNFFKNRIGAGKEFAQPSDIAKLDKTELVNLINTNGKIVPDNVPGNNADEKVAAYASIIKSRAELLYPAVSLVSEVKRSNTPMLKKVSEIETFIDQQPALDLKHDNIDKFLLDKNINLDAGTKNELKMVQRVHKLTPDAKAGTALIDEGLHSSRQIYFMGQARLSNTLEAKGADPKHAAKLYEVSKLQYMQILSRIIEFRPETNYGTPQAIIPQTFTVEEAKKALGDIPSLDTLFGTLDFCDCEHCTSLYGPAAYFTDMLRFLNMHDSLVKQNNKPLTVKDILFDRRPDLGNIKLNCENTNTALPYIDLVCEILENNIAPQQKNFSYQTTLSQKELRAMPQYIRPQAYNTLATADFPMNYSLNLWQEEARACLNFLRVPRWQLMETMQDISVPANKKPDDVSIAAEYFGISSYEKDLIVIARANAADQDKYWSKDENNNMLSGQNQLPAALFMKRAKLNYNETLELLLVKCVNDPANNKSVIERPVDTCDTKEQKITNITVTKLDLAHRFTRLWRKTGFKMWELDLAVRNAGIGKNVMNGDTLVNLKKMKHLQEKLNLPFETLLAFYSTINTEQRVRPEKPSMIIPSLYEKLFQNQAVTNPIDAKFALANDRAHLADETLPLALNAGYTPMPTIVSALATTQADLDLVINRPGNVLNTLSLASLSTMLRYVYLAKGLKLSMKDLLLLLKVTNMADPFATIQTTLDCIKNAEFIRASGLSLLELDYILNFNPDSPIGLRVESVTQLIGLLRKNLAANKQKIDKLNLSAANSNTILNFNADALAAMNNAQLAAAVTPLQTLLTAQSPDFTNASFSQEEVQYITAFDTTTITAQGKTKLTDSIKKLQQNLADLYNQSSNQVKSQVASSFNIADEQVVFLMNLHLPGDARSLQQVLEDENLLAKNPDGTDKEITQANFPAQFKAFALLHKISLLLAKMKISTKNLEWFIANHASVKVLDLAALPVAATAPPNDFNGWLNLNKFLQFTAAFPEPEETSIRKILELAKIPATPKPSITTEIALLTQWKKEDLNSIDTGFNLAVQDYLDAETYLRLQKCAAYIKLAGVDASTLLRWAASSNNLATDAQIALETRNAVKSKYEQNDWLDKIGPIYDDIREMKRKGLIEYHLESSQRNEPEQINFQGNQIPNPLYWKDSNALFKYFLIDVEMCSCQLTSRIKQAISSVQFFVQRCFLNLENRYVKVSQDEKEDRTSPDAWSQWKWMKNYRIWEANRKVFFYPENWLEPELRDDKSPFFTELENEIMQNDVTDENVEAAFQNYLYKAHEVSNLEVMGMYHQLEDLAVDNEGLYEINTVHVIGRTPAIPHVYYYRSYDMNYATWTAWEKIEVDIAGDHVIPVVYNRKLHLFWLVFNEKPKKASKVPAAKPTTGPSEAPEPMKILEVQLAWTVKQHGGWSGKKISKQKLVHPWERPHYSYNLRPYYLAKFNELYLDIYLSTSPEFNNGTFYDPATDTKIKLTNNPFDETFLPWHSSSFVFNGEVTEVKLKGLGGHYKFDGIDYWSYDSYDFVHGNFGEAGRAILPLDPKFEFGPRLRLPGGMHFNNTKLTNNRFNAANPNELRVLENNATVTLLSKAANISQSSAKEFNLVITQQDLQLNTVADHPLVYQDTKRAFFILPEWEAVLNNYGQVVNKVRKYRFRPFYHPYTTLFLRELNRDGVDGLLKRNVQVNPNSYPPPTNFSFNFYSPQNNVIVDDAAKADNVDFTLSGAYSIYNWEIFFHAPLMVACRLMQNQKFEDAMRWFHFIFNPTNVENLPTPQRYWVTKPFFEINSEGYRKQRIENILSNLNIAENRNALIAWKNNPFQPHLIARARPVAYQRNVVMKYLDNLIAWADQLFRRDTIESINEASLLYMLAYEILGDRPVKVPNVKHEDLSFNELETKLDQLANAKVDVLVEDTLLPITAVPSSNGSEPMPRLEIFYFSIPNNDYLVKYWDTVEDRLYKIRNCMNIEGIVRQLPLFEPPIDPALLVKAAAAGMDLGSVLNDLSAPAPHYRFRVVVQKALEFCTEVKSLGEKLLQAIEKKDAEGLSLLRSQQEIQLLQAVKEVKKKQIAEAVELRGHLEKSLALADEKKTYYESRELVNALEVIGAVLSASSAGISGSTAIGELIASQLHLIPSFSIGISGFGGSPQVSMSIGGSMFAAAVQAADSSFSHVGNMLSQVATLLNTMASYQRRKEEWDFQGRLATIEKDQVQFQMNAAEIRQAIAEKELENQELQIENSTAADEYMRNKFSNQQLFNWMISQISTVYFQAYQLAFDMAKKAEKCYQLELGIQSSNFIQFGYWDSLKKGLLSGERLMTDLMRLEAAYLDQNKRELEITKHISLAQMLPLSLIKLKETGECTISLPEWLFDMDYPGHYMRRIRNVSISIPCVTGPYTGVNCTLSLLRSEIRIDPTGGYDKTDENDPRFKVQFGAVSSIATSSAQNDSGMFELNFNDDRYLPFEGSGAVSDWKISMPAENNYFELSSVTDVVLHVSYTAKIGGGLLATNARNNLAAVLPNSTARMFSLRHEFSTEWYKFLHPENGADQELVIALKPEHFPFFVRSKLSSLKYKAMDVVIETKDANDFTANFTITNGAPINGIAISPDPGFDNVHRLSKDLSGASPAVLGELRVKIKQAAAGNFKSLPADLLDNMYLVVQLGS